MVDTTVVAEPIPTMAATAATSSFIRTRLPEVHSSTPPSKPTSHLPCQHHHHSSSSSSIATPTPTANVFSSPARSPSPLGDLCGTPVVSLRCQLLTKDLRCWTLRFSMPPRSMAVFPLFSEKSGVRVP